MSRLKIHHRAFLESAVATKVVTKSDIDIKKYDLSTMTVESDAAEELRKRRIAAVKAMPINLPITIDVFGNGADGVLFDKNRFAGYGYQENLVDGEGGNRSYSAKEATHLESKLVTFKAPNVDSILRDVEAFATKHGLVHDADAVKREVLSRIRSDVHSLLFEPCVLPDDMPF